MRTAIISHPDCRKHKMNPEHPECSGRLDAINDRLLAAGLDVAIQMKMAPHVSRHDLERVHCSDYLDQLESQLPADGLVDLDGDTSLCKDSLKAASRAAGAGVLAVDEIINGRLDAAFCSVRPPGHHAEKDKSMGFCIYNNVAVAAAYALSLGLERVAILDIDVHHGNGTQDIFLDDPRVLFCSSFQFPFYPNTEINPERAHIINSPLKAGENGEAFLEVVKKIWLPALVKFNPQLLIISAGFDAHIEDDMGGLSFTEKDYVEFTQRLNETCAKTQCKGIVSMLEGGYDFSSLGRSAVEHIRALARL